MNEENLRDQINQLIRNEIQENINEFVDMKEEEIRSGNGFVGSDDNCLLYTSPSPRDS